MKLGFLEDLVGHHCKIELEELVRSAVSELVWLVDLLPNSPDVVLKDDLDALAVVAAVVEVTQDEQKPLGGLLVEEFKVDFEDHF